MLAVFFEGWFAAYPAHQENPRVRISGVQAQPHGEWPRHQKEAAVFVSRGSGFCRPSLLQGSLKPRCSSLFVSALFVSGGPGAKLAMSIADRCRRAMAIADRCRRSFKKTS